MHSITRRKALGRGARLLSLVSSLVLAFSLFVSSATITGAVDKVQIRKVADVATINAGAVASFTITVTTAPFPIDNVVLTDVLPGPASMTWTVSGDGNLATPNCNGTYSGGSTLTCNFGTIGNFGVVATRTIHVSATTTAANCPRIDNEARVSTTEPDDTLSNNKSSASINVVCPTPNAQIAPTATTCQQFRDGTAADLTTIAYNVRSSGNIGNVAPGIGFYFVAAGAGAHTISQSDTGSTPAFGVQSVQIYFPADCSRDQTAEATTVIASGGASFTLGGPRIIRLAFDPNTVVGSVAPSPSTVTYTYTTSGVANSTDSVNLVRNNPA